MTKCTASWEPSDVSFQSNKALKMGGGHFTPPPYQTRVKIPCKGRVSLCRNVCHLDSHLIIKGLGPSNEHYRMCDQLQSPFGDNLKALRPSEM